MSLLQTALSLALIAGSLFDKNSYSGYHNLALGVFLLVTGILGALLASRKSGQKLVADAWLIISITTAYLSIEVAPLFGGAFQALGIGSATLLTIMWVVALYLAHKERIPLLKI